MDLVTIGCVFVDNGTSSWFELVGFEIEPEIDSVEPTTRLTTRLETNKTDWTERVSWERIGTEEGLELDRVELEWVSWLELDRIRVDLGMKEESHISKKGKVVAKTKIDDSELETQ